MFNLIKTYSQTVYYSPRLFNFINLQSVQYFNNLSFSNILYYYNVTSLKLKSLKISYFNFNILIITPLFIFFFI